MFAPKEHVFGVTLQRYDRNTPWGIRIIGGADLNSPIVITRAAQGSPCDKKLMPGDEIRKIGPYDARDIRHQDALNLFQNAGTTIKLDIKRDLGMKLSNSVNGGGVTPLSSRPQSALSSAPSRPSTPGMKCQTPTTPKVVFPPPLLSLNDYSYFDGFGQGFSDGSNEAEVVKNQPYRTTPLVLPGAKAKHEKELAPTESYLRHHPNPMMRAPPSHYEFLPQDVAMKQRVADTILQRIEREEALAGKQIIHKQFNTPIGLYSDKNIVDTIQHQTGIAPALSKSPSFGRTGPPRNMGPRKTVAYDPAKSETFKALQEEQYGGDGQVHEVTVPVQPKVFTPNRQPAPPQRVAHQPAQTHTYDPLSHSSATPNVHHLPYVNSMGHSDEQIAQSGSFKRLMNLVLSENY